MGRGVGGVGGEGRGGLEGRVGSVDNSIGVGEDVVTDCLDKREVQYSIIRMRPVA